MIGCALDQDGCMDLLAVLRIMNQVDQEQAWAIAYEFAALMQRLWPAGNCGLIDNLAQIYIHRDGFIHEKSLLVPPSKAAIGLQLRDASKQQDQQQQHQKSTGRRASTTTISREHQENTEAASLTKTTKIKTTNSTSEASLERSKSTGASKSQQQLPPTPPITPELSETHARRRLALSETELVASLGKALFWILDFGIADDEERKLSEQMEYLISESQHGLSLTRLLEICRGRLNIASKSQADLHYRDVCKSLVSETIKLSILLDKIYTATMALRGANLSTSGIAENKCDNILSQASDLHHLDNHHLSDLHYHHHQHHLHDHHYVHVNHDDLCELGLPLASLRVLGISEWARLMMKVINELRQRGKLELRISRN